MLRGTRFGHGGLIRPLGLRLKGQGFGRRLGQHLSELRPLNHFLLRKEMGQIIKDLAPLREDSLHPLMGFLDDPGDLFINLGGFLFAVGFGRGKISREEHGLTGALIGHQSQTITHAIFRDHGTGNVGSPLQVVLGPRGDFSKNQLLRHPAS